VEAHLGPPLTKSTAQHSTAQYSSVQYSTVQRTVLGRASCGTAPPATDVRALGAPLRRESALKGTLPAPVGL